MPHSFCVSFGCVVKAKCENFKHDRYIKVETRHLCKIHLEIASANTQKMFNKSFKLEQHSGIFMSFDKNACCAIYLRCVHGIPVQSTLLAEREADEIGHIRIPGIGLELACNWGSCGESF